MPGPVSEALFERASGVIPGGVNSPVRSFTSVGSRPYFVSRAGGAFVTDADGSVYLDYVQSWGASILGHGDAEVLAAIASAAEAGTTYGAPTEGEVRLAEELVAAVDGLDMVRLVSSGTEATMTALRVARGATGRPRVVKFAGCYHGHADALLAAGGSGVATLGLPGSKGVPESAVADTVVVPYNQVPELDASMAAVIVEPVAANMGLVPPASGFLQGLRAACDDAGALLIFDEVITGFRLTRGSVSRLVGVAPDLFTFGKVIGGGLPLAAVGGRRDLMECLAPLGAVYQAGTLSGNPLATAAGRAVLGRLGTEQYEGLSSKVARLGSGLAAAISAEGLKAQVPVYRSLFGVYFADEPVADYEDARAAAANGLYASFFNAMLAEGVALAPSPFEVGFCSLAHGEDDIDRTIEAAGRAAAVVAGSL
ncbi:MAG: glutamate-1-semialdehyde 2,1-aminomutase [Acidimicrobiales bacterium]